MRVLIPGATAGDDTIQGSGADEIYRARAGNDTLIDEGGTDLFDGGAGSDTILLDLIGTVTGKFLTDRIGDLSVSLRDGTQGDAGVAGDVDDLISIENYRTTGNFNMDIIGSSVANRLQTDAGSDILRGLGGNDYIDAGPGNDRLFGANGRDQLIAGTGDDVLEGGSGNDILQGTDGSNTLRGGAGNDTITDGRGSDTIEGGPGIDTFARDYGGSFSFVPVIDLAAGRIFAEGGDPDVFEPLRQIENVEVFGMQNHKVVGTAGRNVLETGTGADTILAGGGNDTIRSGNGNDVLRGGNGNDVIDDGFGNDRLFGGAGNDVFRNLYGSDTADGGAGRDLVTLDTSPFGSGSFVSVVDLQAGTIGSRGNPVSDRIRNIEDVAVVGGRLDFEITGDGKSNDLTGGRGDDTISGQGGRDSVDGGRGDDVLQGGNGNDEVVGGRGKDQIKGGNGSDTLIGGRGNDTIDGGRGADTFIYGDLNEGRDTIGDFELGTDGFNLQEGVSIVDLAFTTSTGRPSDVTVVLSSGTRVFLPEVGDEVVPADLLA